MSEINTTLAFYTNNIVPKKLLERAIEDAKDVLRRIPSAELVIASHFPVLADHIDISDQFEQYADARFDKAIANTSFAIEDDLKGRVRNYVVGQLEQSLDSIIDQIMTIITYAKGENILLTEHDVLYPAGYQEAVIDALDSYDLVVPMNYIYLGQQGFFSCGDKCFMLSRYNAKKHLFKDYFNKIKSLGGVECLEPYLKGHFEDERDPNVALLTYDNCTVIETDPTMDIKHGTNTSGNVIVDDHFSDDDYWGNKNQYLSLIDEDYENFVGENPSFGYGLCLV
jgi:hypothetical protein